MNSINLNTHPIRALAQTDYPRLIKEAGRPPKHLYVRGDLPAEENRFLTVVGSRTFTEYGRTACQKIIAGLKGYPVVIVSGLALGMDSIAHDAALEAGLKTVAIPGSGLADSIIYPASNIELAHRILHSGGCLLSPFEGKVVDKGNWVFPFRNRIMAALSHATLVIEAELQSGSLITSRDATEMNRDVFAVPGSILSDKSKGPHQLIRMGATPITCPEDLIEALGFKASEKRAPIDYSTLSVDEARIVGMLDSPLPRETVIEKLGMKASRVSALVSMLELKGIVEEKLGELRRI